MTKKSLPGKAVDGALKIARAPVDKLLDVAPENRATASLGLAVDRTDAAVRGAAGTVLRDGGLSQDADMRRSATSERERALKLRGKAEEKVDTAEAEAEKKRNEVEARNQKAEADAKKKREQAKKQRDQKKAQAEKEEQQRKKAASEKAAEKKAKAAKASKADKLAQLEKKSDALEVKEAAVTAQAEARRLEGAASKTKEKRKAKS
jgi:hypothetical protein